jgi:hypothetical protein
MVALAFWGLGSPASRAEGKRFLVDEVVAVVAAHAITLSEVRAEACIALVQEHGAAAAKLEPDRGLLAATLQRMVDQRLVLSEMESLRSFELERTEVEAAMIRFRARVGAPDRYEAFTRRIEMTDDEISQVLARQMRYARYIDNKAKLQGALRKGEAEEACQKELGRPATPVELDGCTRRLEVDRYRKVTQDVLAELRKRVDVRVLDPIEER